MNPRHLLSNRKLAAGAVLVAALLALGFWPSAVAVDTLPVTRGTLRVTVDEERMLLWVLRHDLGLTGTKFGCGQALCGACTVLVNSEAVRSCATAVKDVAGKQVLTIEGLSASGKLHPMQEAFLKRHAFPEFGKFQDNNKDNHRTSNLNNSNSRDDNLRFSNHNILSLKKNIKRKAGEIYKVGQQKV